MRNFKSFQNGSEGGQNKGLNVGQCPTAMCFQSFHATYAMYVFCAALSLLRFFFLLVKIWICLDGPTRGAELAANGRACASIIHVRTTGLRPLTYSVLHMRDML